MSYRELSNYIDSQKDQMIQDIIDFVKIPSVSSDINEVTRSLLFFLDLAKKMGFEAKAVLDNQIGVIEIGEGDETIGILVHVDVVPPGDIKLWNIPPFDPIVKDGYLFGRGTIDDKGPAISVLYSLKALKELGLTFNKKIQLIVGTQEEVEWKDMNAYIENYPLPDFGFTPDGEFPLCNIEKGFANIFIQIPIGPITESGLYLKSINGGIVINGIPDTCTATICNAGKEFYLKAPGKSAHASIPQKGDNAIVNICKLLRTLPLVSNGIKKAVELVAENFNTYDCKGINLHSSNEYYKGEYIHKNIASVTMIYTDEQHVSIGFNMRHTYGTTEEEIRAAFEEVAQAVGGKVTQFICKPPIYISKYRPFMKVFEEVYDDISGYKNEFTIAHGASYAKAMPNIVSWGPLFPGEMDTCHEENERISVDNLMKMTKIYAESLRRMAFSEKKYK